MALDPQTEQRLREFFGGQRCCRCGGPAARLVHDHFYCHQHFLSARRKPEKKGRKPAPAAPAVEPPRSDYPRPVSPGAEATPALPLINDGTAAPDASFPGLSNPPAPAA